MTATTSAIAANGRYNVRAVVRGGRDDKRRPLAQKSNQVYNRGARVIETVVCLPTIARIFYSLTVRTLASVASTDRVCGLLLWQRSMSRERD
jgi:hypothetical protein